MFAYILHIHIYIYIFIYIYIYIYIHTHTYTHISMYAYIHFMSNTHLDPPCIHPRVPAVVWEANHTVLYSYLACIVNT